MADDNRRDTHSEQPHIPAPAKGAKGPAVTHTPGQQPYYPRAAGEGDASAEANAKVAADIATSASRPIPADQLVTMPAEGTVGRAMYVLIGPYRGNVLTMTDADGESAKDNHWAIDAADVMVPFDAAKPYEHDHELTDEDRAYAVKEANEWAAAQNPPPEPPDNGDEAAPEGETEDARQAREKRNADRKAQRERDRKPQASQHPAPNRGRAATPRPAGTYETR